MLDARSGFMSEQPNVSKKGGTPEFTVLDAHQAGKGKTSWNHIFKLAIRSSATIITLSDYRQGVFGGYGMMLASCAPLSGASIIIQLNF